MNTTSRYPYDKAKRTAFVVALTEIVKDAAQTIMPEPRNCLTCIHWHGSAEVCKLAGQRPPLSVIVAGCEHWLDSDVPW